MSEKSRIEKLSFTQKRKLLARALRDIRRLAPGFITMMALVCILEALKDFVPIVMSGMIVDGFAKGITYVLAALVVTWELYGAGVKTGGMAVVNYMLLAAVVVLLIMQNTLRSYLLDNYFGEYQAVKDVHIYGNKKFVLRRSDELFDKWHTSKKRKDKVIRRQQLVDETCDVVRSVLIYGFAAGKAAAGAVSAGALVRDVQSFYRIQQGFNRAIESLTKIDKCMFPIKLIYDLFRYSR